MKTKNIFKKYGLIGFAIFVVVFFTATIALNEIQEYNVDVMEKSPVFPYQNYDYMTTEDTFYSIDKEYSVVPSYFRTDFASIPRVLWFIDAPYKASFIYPALWHDYNYSCPSKRTRKQMARGKSTRESSPRSCTSATWLPRPPSVLDESMLGR